MKKKECTGCGACYNACSNNCIVMKKDFDGCYYPFVNREKCTNCEKCRRVCPIMCKGEEKQELEKKNVYVGYCQEDEVRNGSSSGGIFPLVAEWIIARGGLVFGACYQENRVVHSYGSSKKDIERFKGSKYVQSDIGITYQEAEKELKKGRVVLFTGVPCQIEGLKRYLGKEYENLYTVDLICHGVGASGIWEKYIEVFHGKKEIVDINFKNKDNGWSHEQLVIKYGDGTEYRKFSLEDYYTYGFNKNIFLRPSCYQCKFKGMDRKSDLTIGDAWGVERYAPRFRDDKGCSLIFVHSEKGKKIVEEIKHRITYEIVEAEKVVRFNQRMISSVADTPERNRFYNNLKKYSFRLCMKMMKAMKGN